MVDGNLVPRSEAAFLLVSTTEAKRSVHADLKRAGSVDEVVSTVLLKSGLLAFFLSARSLLTGRLLTID